MAVLRILDAIKPQHDALFAAIEKGDINWDFQNPGNIDDLLKAGVEKKVISQAEATLVAAASKAQEMVAFDKAYEHAADLTAQGKKGWSAPTAADVRRLQL
jgi:hypothetical protein